MHQHYIDNTSCISIVEDKIVNTGVKHIGIPVYFLQEQFENGIFVPKYEKFSVMPEDMRTKPCLGAIISRINKWMNGFRFYPTSVTEHYKLMILHEFVVI